MDQDQSATLAASLSAAAPQESAVGALDDAQAAEPGTEQTAFGSVANPKRLRLGASSAL